MKTLLLLRHAKSSWKDRSLRDFDRPLAPRGHRASDAIGQWLRDRDYGPDRVLCSSARRTMETWERTAEHLPSPPPVEFLSELYLAPPETILQILRYQVADQDRLMVIGHNPGIAEAAMALTRDGPSDLIGRMDTKYPTGALTVLRFEVEEWSAVTWRSGTLEHFIRPKDLS